MEQLRGFYNLRAAEEPETDAEAILRFRKALRAANLYLRERLLDVGAKWGGLGQCARDLGLKIEYTGLELSERNVARAAALGLDVRLADASLRLPVGDGEYDCVVCFELLEHLPTPLDALREFRRALKPQGRAVISVPNPYSWSRCTGSSSGGPIPKAISARSPRPSLTTYSPLPVFVSMQDSEHRFGFRRHCA